MVKDMQDTAYTDGLKASTRAADNVRRVIMRKAMLDYLYSVDKTLREELGAVMENGETIRAHDTLGDPLGTVVMTQPSMDPVVDDQGAACGWASGINPDWVYFRLPDMNKEQDAAEEVIEFLIAEGRTDLIFPVLDKDAEKQIMALVKTHYREKGELPAGWKFPATKRGSMRVSPSKEAKALARQMVEGKADLKALTQGPEEVKSGE